MDIDTGGASAPADTGSVASNEPVIAATPAPISTEPRQATPAQAEETARQAAEAKAATADKDTKKAAAEPVAEKPKPVSTREALRRAADKVNAEPAKDAKPVAEKAAPIKDDGPARAEDGKFASKDPAASAAAKEAPKAEPAKAAPAADATKPVADAKTAPDAKAASEPAKDATAPVADKPAVKTPLPSHTAEPPPSRFSPDAKDAWASTPDPVRAEVHRAVKELTQGFEKHRADAESYKDYREFDDMAKQAGKKGAEVFREYVAMEKNLREQPIAGLEHLCERMGLSLREVAAHVLGQTPEQNASKADATIREMRAEIAELKKGLGGVTQTFEQQRTQTTTEQVTKFAADHPRFEELSDHIVKFMKSGWTTDLAEAYALAERLNPAPAKQVEAEVPVASSAPAAVAEIKPTPAPIPDLTAQTLRGQKSIAGSPTPGSSPASRQPSNTIRDALRKARAAAG